MLHKAVFMLHILK